MRSSKDVESSIIRSKESTEDAYFWEFFDNYALKVNTNRSCVLSLTIKNKSSILHMLEYDFKVCQNSMGKPILIIRSDRVLKLVLGVAITNFGVSANLSLFSDFWEANFLTVFLFSYISQWLIIQYFVYAVNNLRVRMLRDFIHHNLLDLSNTK